MSDTPCVACKKPKTVYSCEICEDPLCKACTQFLEEGTFSFRSELPPELGHSRYCPSCFVTQVEPELEAYREKMELAKQVYFFFKTQKRAIPVLKRAESEVEVEDCADRNETILRLAFFAVEQGF